MLALNAQTLPPESLPKMILINNNVLAITLCAIRVCNFSISGSHVLSSKRVGFHLQPYAHADHNSSVSKPEGNRFCRWCPRRYQHAPHFWLSTFRLCSSKVKFRKTDCDEVFSQAFESQLAPNIPEEDNGVMTRNLHGPILRVAGSSFSFGRYCAFQSRWFLPRQQIRNW